MWDSRYAEPGFAYGIEPNDFIVEQAEGLRMGRALCLGAGEGRNAIFLARRGFSVTAVDLSQVGLAKAKAWAEEHGLALETEVADLGTYQPPPESCELVVLVFCHLPPDLRPVVHRRAVEALAPGGTLLLEAYGKQQLGYGTGGPPAEPMLYDLDELRTDFDGLELLLAREQVRPIHEGRYHHGQGAVIQILGRKPG